MPSGWGEGPRSFTAELTRFAETVPCAHLAPLVARMNRPLGIAVVGRRGVGRRTVEAALRLHGVRVAATEPDIRVIVIAEAFKPEDEALLGSDPGSTVMVLTKADVFGAARDGPLAAASRCAAELSAATGIDVVVMIGLLATVADLDDESLGALRTLVTGPAELGSVDAFVATDHPLARAVRERLLDRLDRFGIAHALLALAEGAAPDAVVTRLRELSNVDGVLAGLRRAAASAGYRRIQRALAETRCLHARLGDERLEEFLRSDAVAMAVMTAAVDVVEAAGLAVDRGDDAGAHARRAVQWSRYGRGPVDALHRGCAADIVRGSLRLLDRESGR